MPPVAKKMYRVYIWLGAFRYYANRPLNPNDKTRWMTFNTEYPEVYTWREVLQLREKYADQNIKWEECYVQEDV